MGTNLNPYLYRLWAHDDRAVAVGFAYRVGSAFLRFCDFAAACPPINDAFRVVGEIALLLAGAFPLMKVITKVCQKPLAALGRRIHINETSVSGLLTSTVNSITMVETIEYMDSRGVVLNMAFAVSAAFVFGDHLAFVGGWRSEWIPALMIGKLTAGVSALLFALLFTKCRNDTTKKNEV